VCSALPDVDVLGFDLGIPYDGLFGHRGLTHSLLFALVLAVAVAVLVHLRDPGTSLGDVCLYLFLATASHGVFDALTNGGRGIAFFAPFSSTRYFFPFRSRFRRSVSPASSPRVDGWCSGASCTGSGCHQVRSLDSRCSHAKLRAADAEDTTIRKRTLSVKEEFVEL
jgi:hypothetical protein